MICEFNLQSISKCRSLLMGYAILGVLVGHIFAFGDVETTNGVKLLNWFGGLVHTSGFLFLSGFGVCYSLHKNGNIVGFYRRRFYRFLLPFLIMAMPFFIIVCYVNGYGIIQYFAYISTAEFWINGNYHGMWYIAISLFLYVVTPPICKISAYITTKTIVRDLILLGISILFCYCIKCYFPTYYDNLSIGLTPLPMFYVGFLLGDLSRKSIGLSKKAMFGICFVTALLYFVDTQVYGITFIMHCMFGILLACFIFKLLMEYNAKIVLSLFNWLGKYTLELYILHIYYWFIIKGVCHYGYIFNIVVAVMLSLLTCVPVHKVFENIERRFK